MHNFRVGVRGTLPAPSAHRWNGVLFPGPLTPKGRLQPACSPTPTRAESRDRAGAGWEAPGRAAAQALGALGALGALAAGGCGSPSAVSGPRGASARSNSLAGSPRHFSSQPPAPVISLSLRLSLGLGSPYPICFLLNARVSCLQYSSHMVAGQRGAPKGRPSPVCAPARGLPLQLAFPPVIPRWVPLPWDSVVTGGIN